MATEYKVNVELPKEILEVDDNSSAKQEANGIGDVPQTVMRHKR